MQPLPLDTAGITPGWLTEALSARHPGVRVASVDVLHERGSTNHHVRLGITYDEAAGLPDTMFAKMASLDAEHRIAIGSTGMGTREARFYDELAPSTQDEDPDELLRRDPATTVSSSSCSRTSRQPAPRYPTARGASRLILRRRH